MQMEVSPSTSTIPVQFNNIEVKKNWNALFRCYLPESVDDVLEFKASVMKALPTSVANRNGVIPANTTAAYTP